MFKEFILPIIWAALSAFGFGMMFGLKSRKLMYVAIGGGLSWFAYLIIANAGVDEAIAYAAAAFICTVYSEIMARIIKTPVTAFVIPANIALVPGAALFHSLLAFFQKDNARFWDRGKYMLIASGAMALGIFTASMLFKLIGILAHKREAH